MNRLRVILTITLPLVLCGCLGHYKGRPERRGPRAVEVRGRTDNAPAVRWAKVFLEQGPKAPHLGYVRSERVDGGFTHWVYDLKFHLVGKVTPHGQTFKLNSRGKEVDQGHFNVQGAMLKIFGYAKFHPVELRKMPPPRQS